MSESFPVNTPPSAGPQGTPPDHAALWRVPADILRQHPRVSQWTRDDVQLFVLNDFLPTGTCDEITALIKTHLRPSAIAVRTVLAPHTRNSSTCDLSAVGSALVRTLDKRICRGLGIRPAYGEELQGQHYATGQEYQSHVDFFVPNTQAYEQFAGARGNRTWTFMVYLNDPPRGGATTFPALGFEIKPRRGRAVVWNNLDAAGKPNYLMKHAALPVEDGEKVVITKWFRECGSGPMFFDR